MSSNNIKYASEVKQSSQNHTFLFKSFKVFTQIRKASTNILNSKPQDKHACKGYCIKDNMYLIAELTGIFTLIRLHLYSLLLLNVVLDYLVYSI